MHILYVFTLYKIYRYMHTWGALIPIRVSRIILNIFSNIPAEKREKLLHSLDADGDGRIDLEEFRQLFKK